MGADWAEPGRLRPAAELPVRGAYTQAGAMGWAVAGSERSWGGIHPAAESRVHQRRWLPMRRSPPGRAVGLWDLTAGWPGNRDELRDVQRDWKGRKDRLR